MQSRKSGLIGVSIVFVLVIVAGIAVYIYSKSDHHSPTPPTPPTPPAPGCATSNCHDPWGSKGPPSGYIKSDADQAALGSWIRNVIDDQAQWVTDSDMMYGIKVGKPPEKGDSKVGTDGIGSICPYGMYFDGINGKSLKPEDVLGTTSPCVDYPSSTPGCTTSILGQCVDDKAIVVPNPLPRLFMTWFELPSYILEAGALDYINLLFQFCVKSKIQNSNGISGLCFPMVVWPDDKNMTWLLKGGKTFPSTNANRALYGTWVAKNFIDAALASNISPGILLYTNFKDGPWAGSSSIVKGVQDVAAGFYSTNSDGSGGDYVNLINPLTSKAFGPPPYVGEGWPGGVTTFSDCIDPAGKAGGDDSCALWIWGAVIHFINNYVLPNCSSDPHVVLQQLWFHMDKEGCSCGDPGQYIPWMEAHIGVTFDLDNAYVGATKPNYSPPETPVQSEYETRLFLATGLGTPGAKAIGDDGKTYNSISVPENYWYAGNQLPCGGDPGSYNFARTACTSLNPHRRFRGNAKGFYEYTAGEKGSDCCSNWLGDGKWGAEVDGIRKENFSNATDLYGKKFIWPSFSIENLSLCDKDDDDCYSFYIQNGQKSIYPTPNKNSTVCANMMFGNNKPDVAPPQGTRACGVFDGFSYWTWAEMNDWFNTFASKTGASNMILYEASFIPYHWFSELGLMDGATGSLWPAGYTGDTSTRVLTGIPPPTVEKGCTKDADCGPNFRCLDPLNKPVVTGQTGVCLNLCTQAPTGVENIGDATANTVWLTAGTQTEAATSCTAYYDTMTPVDGTEDPPSVTKKTYTPPFDVSCVTTNPVGSYPEAKVSGFANTYSCSFHQA